MAEHAHACVFFYFGFSGGPNRTRKASLGGSTHGPDILVRPLAMRSLQSLGLGDSNSRLP